MSLNFDWCMVASSYLPITASIAGRGIFPTFMVNPSQPLTASSISIAMGVGEMAAKI